MFIVRSVAMSRAKVCFVVSLCHFSLLILIFLRVNVTWPYGHGLDRIDTVRAGDGKVQVAIPESQKKRKNENNPWGQRVFFDIILFN